MSAVAVELLLSTICINATYCPPVYDNPVRDAVKSAKAQRMKLLANELNGKHIRIGTIQNFPLSWTEDENGRLVGGGVSFIFVEILRKKFNFTYDVVVPAKNWQGGPSRLESSLLGLVNRSEVDLAAAFLPILSETRKVVSPSPQLDDGSWVMMMKRPTESAAGSGLLAPFEQYVWYLIIVAVLAYGPCIVLLTRLRRRLGGGGAGDDDEPIALSPSVWFVYGAFIKQGTTLTPEANSTRVLFATWWMFIILLSSFYTANLTAFLTLSKFTLDIEVPKDLSKKHYRWIAMEGSAVEYVVTDPDEELFYLNEMVVNGKGVFRPVTKVNNFLPEVTAGAVLVEDRVSVEHVMYEDYQTKARAGVPEADRCTYVTTERHFMTRPRTFAYPRNSTLQQLFDPILQALVEAGIVKYLVHRNLPSTKICPLDLQSKERRLRNSDLMTTYMLAAVGLAAATATFAGELFVRRCYTVKIKTGKMSKWQSEFEGGKRSPFWDSSRPPPYDSLFGRGARGLKGRGKQPQYSTEGKRQLVNGREYWVVNTLQGDVRLIPIRTPSALLFQSS